MTPRPHLLVLVCLIIGALLSCASSLAIPTLRRSTAAYPPIRAQRANNKHAQKRHRHVRATPRYPTLLKNDIRDEIEREAQRKAYNSRASGGGAGSTVGGAVIGGLLGGPFGALFGAQIGSSLGNASELDKARKEAMERKGLTPEMLDQATEIGAALRQSVEGLRATQESVDTSQRLAKTLDRQEKSIYEKAKGAIQSGDEEGARRMLLEREAVKEKLLKVLKSLADERKRLVVMESNVEALETRGLEIESLMRRTVGAASLQNSADVGFTLEPTDPLLQKFKDLGM